MNKKTKALTTEQYKAIVTTMKAGFCGCRPNERIATALTLEGNLGLRISDIVKLRPPRYRPRWRSLPSRPHRAENRQAQNLYSPSGNSAIY